MTAKVFYTRPSITDLEISYATDAAAAGWGAKCYEYIYRFEDGFKRHIGSDYAIATSSCTGAMHMGLAALGIGPGDEVILADTNWIATVAPVVHLGATPIFVDILPDTWCIDPDQVERHLTPRTKAIIATHLYGNLCDMDALLDIGRRSGVAVIEDAAEAIGSIWRTSRAGSMGAFGTFSFHGTKTLTTGEGGMLVTNDRMIYERVLALSNHGRTREQSKQFWPDMIGFKYKMSNISAAIGCAQLERIDDLVARKREILSKYKSILADIPEISMNPTCAGTLNGAWMPTAVFDRTLGITREVLLNEFKAESIDARVFFHPLSSLPMFIDKKTNRNAWDIPQRAINLPSYHDMANADIELVASTMLRLIRAKHCHEGTRVPQHV